MRAMPAIWFPTVRTNTGTDVFTERLATRLQMHGFRTEITWLPLRAEYAPWTVSVPKPPDWATACHVNTWLHPRLIPETLPVVATLHHSIHDPALRPYKGWLRAAYHRNWIAPVERRVLYRSNKVVPVSQFVADMARKTLADVPMQTIYNGIDTDVFKPSNRSNDLGGAFRLLYVGNWMARKGVDLLAPIMRELGDGFELRYTSGPAAEESKVHMPLSMVDIGRLQGDAAVVEEMQNADALIFPTRSEGFGLVAIEAMACGLPVVASRIGPLIEIIEHGESGLLCPVDDVIGFAAAIRRLSKDPILRDRMRHTASKRVQERFSEKAMVEKYIDVYRSVASASLGPGA